MDRKEEECILWPHGRDKFGYARAKVSFHKSRLAHRVICELKNGPPPLGRPIATHTCGQGSMGCVNPLHLEWGSHQSNSDDKKHHGTFPIGEMVSIAVLNPEKVRQIRSMKLSGMSHRKVAKIIGVTHGTVQAVHERRTWVHVD